MRIEISNFDCYVEVSKDTEMKGTCVRYAHKFTSKPSSDCKINIFKIRQNSFKERVFVSSKKVMQKVRIFFTYLFDIFPSVSGSLLPDLGKIVSSFRKLGNFLPISFGERSKGDKGEGSF